MPSSWTLARLSTCEQLRSTPQQCPALHHAHVPSTHEHSACRRAGLACVLAAIRATRGCAGQLGQRAVRRQPRARHLGPRHHCVRGNNAVACAHKQGAGPRVRARRRAVPLGAASCGPAECVAAEPPAVHHHAVPGARCGGAARRGAGASGCEQVRPEHACDDSCSRAVSTTLGPLCGGLAVTTADS